MRASGGALFPEPTSSTSAANSGLPQEAEEKDGMTPVGGVDNVASKGGSASVCPLHTQRSQKAPATEGGGESATSAASSTSPAPKGSAVFRYTIEELKSMKEFPSSKLPMDPKSQLAQIMSKMASSRRTDGYKGGPNRSNLYGGADEASSFHSNASHGNVESQGSLLGVPGNLRPSGPLAPKSIPAPTSQQPNIGTSGDGLASFSKSVSLSDKVMDSTEAAVATTAAAVGQPPPNRGGGPALASARQNSGFPPPPPPPPEIEQSGEGSAHSSGFLPAQSGKQVDGLDRPSSIPLGAASAFPAENWNPQQQKIARPLITQTSSNQDLIFANPKTHDVFLSGRGDGVGGQASEAPPHLDQTHGAVYDYYNHRFGEQMHQPYATSGMNVWGSQEQDLWDSPLEGGDSDIFTLGDIRQAEHTIETQGISAESYADLRTRKIFSDVAERNKRQTRSDLDTSQDLFFFDNNARLPAGADQRNTESRFLGMFEANQQPGQRVPMRPYQSQMPMNANYLYQQHPSSAGPASSGQWNVPANTSQPPIDRSPDKAMMREHLLKILGLKSAADGKPQQATAQELHYKQHQSQQHQSQQQQVFLQMGSSAASSRPSNTISSRPLNPAAPQFSPLGLYSNINTDAHSLKKNIPGIPPPPPPMDYRRQPGMYEHMQAGQGMTQLPPNPLMWNQRPSPMNTHHQMGLEPQEVDLPPRLAVKPQTVPKQQTPQIPEQQAIAAAQFLQKHLMANANLTPDQIQQVMQFFNKNKGTLLASQLLMANQNARRKEFEVASGSTKEHQAAALLHSATAQLRQQSAAANPGFKPNMQQQMPPQMSQPPPQSMQQSSASSAAAANPYLQQQLQAVQKAFSATMSRAQQGNRAPPSPQDLQKIVASFQNLQQRQQQQAATMSQQPSRRPINSPAQPIPAPSVASQQDQQQKLQQQVFLANAIEQLTAMAQRVKIQQHQQQQQAAGQPELSPQQLLTQKQLQQKQIAQAQAHMQAQVQAQAQQQGSPQGGNLYEATQRSLNASPTNELKQQLTNALTATIQQNPSKSEQAASHFSALLKNLPANHNLSQQIHAMLAQANQNRPAHQQQPVDESGATRFPNQQPSKSEVAKPVEGGCVPVTGSSPSGFKSKTEVDCPAEGSDKENGLSMEGGDSADLKNALQQQESEHMPPASD
eukprot:Gregarina_sp_Poly_1__9638@NODE_60_length_16930_cov_139_480579_g51_i0_p1_GENE_NODE_60_length_16930_cov_139_480579_g51_i0NODE_60_length_16930_cov_139_480579_g51_i0_p1_ORF_typecomplete_len1168_score244_63RSF/PF14876_6/1_8e03RSF/PF14876_6/0_031_NODE_60_length_16930_cov_139_480579_g51_i01111814621